MLGICGGRFVQRDNVVSLYLPPWLETSPVPLFSNTTLHFKKIYYLSRDRLGADTPFIGN